jgi:hypothetical protein
MFFLLTVTVLFESFQNYWKMVYSFFAAFRRVNSGGLKCEEQPFIFHGHEYHPIILRTPWGVTLPTAGRGRRLRVSILRQKPLKKIRASGLMSA